MALSAALELPESLREAGINITTGNILTYVQALEKLGVSERRGLYWAGRTTLVHRPEDIAIYDALFEQFSRGGLVQRSTEQEQEQVDLRDELHGSDTEGGAPNEETPKLASSSRVELLRHKDFGECSEEELNEAYRLMQRLRFEGPLRKSRRLEISSRPRGAFDTRRTVRNSIQRGGELIERSFLGPTDRARRVVMLLDISGSMQPYARALLRFSHIVVASGRNVEAFALGTRLTRLTRKFKSLDPNIALPSASAMIEDLFGGTRLGEGLRTFNDQFAIRGLGRGAVIVVVSDGWDRGAPGQLGAEMARLNRVAHRIIWANPWKASPGFSPSARGMAACLPYIDVLMEAHSVAALTRLADEVKR